MTIAIKKDRALAARSFYNQIIFQAAYPHLLEGLAVPVGLIQSAQALRNADVRRLNREQKRVRRQIDRAFGTLWRKHEREVLELKRQLVARVPTLRAAACAIPMATGVRWPYRQAVIYPALRNWASQRQNRIAVGIRPFRFAENLDVAVIIHELIHVNTVKVSFRKRLKYERDAIEVATTLLTRKVTRKLLVRRGTDVADLALGGSFLGLRKHEAQLERLSARARSFAGLVVRVDRFLTAVRHKRFYG